jgi:uncharacterized membrane protein
MIAAAVILAATAAATLAGLVLLGRGERRREAHEAARREILEVAAGTASDLAALSSRLDDLRDDLDDLRDVVIAVAGRGTTAGGPRLQGGQRERS